MEFIRKLYRYMDLDLESSLIFELMDRDFFGYLEDERSSQDIEEYLALEKGGGALGEALVSLGYADKKEAGYKSSEEARTFLSSRGSSSFRGLLLYRRGGMGVGSLFSKKEKKVSQGDFSQLARYAMVEMEHFRVEDLLRESKEVFGKKEELKILDLGSGCGGLAMALKEAYPKSEVVLADRKEVLEIAREYASQRKLSLHYIEGDFMEEPWGEDYDLILASGVLNLAENYKTILEKMNSALAPEGHVFVYSILLEEDPQKGRLSKLRWLTASIERGRGPLEKEEMIEGFEDSGFKVIKKTRDGLYPLWVLRKEKL